MRHHIYKLGHTRTVIALTLVAVLLALIITLAFVYILHQIGIYVYPVVAGLISICAALIIAPLMSWYLVGLILTIHQLEEEMRALATYDTLTGLLSRRVFLEQTDYFHNIAIRDGLEYSVIIVDLDNFKKINDQYGHSAGDKTLESFGKAVRNTFRESDLACRFGGDEFVFFFPIHHQNKRGIFRNGYKL